MRRLLCSWLCAVAACSDRASPGAPQSHGPTAAGSAAPVHDAQQAQALDCAAPAQADREVVIANPELRAGVVAALQLRVTEAGEPRPLLRCRQLAQLRALALGDVDGLAGIEVLASLEQLRADHIAHGGLSPLAGLRRLRVLELGFRETLSVDRRSAVDDLTPLRGLAELETLHVRGARVRDLAPIAELRKLRELDLELNSIASLAPLQGMTQLAELNVADNAIQDIAVIRTLTGLATLNVSGNQLGALDALGSLPALRELDISDNPVRSVAPLAGLAAIEMIRLNRTSVEDIRPLRQLPRLKTLYFCATPAEVGAPWRANAPIVEALGRRGASVICRGACMH
jgi:Leucine Rich repeats (2 copies)